MNPSGITQVISPKMPLTDFSVWSGQLRTTYSIVHNAYAVIHHIHFQKWVRIPLVVRQAGVLPQILQEDLR